ncbi:hypothetical protein PMAYCL1PPCAC_15981, partial [Pristionchus mayeri]
SLIFSLTVMFSVHSHLFRITHNTSRTILIESPFMQSSMDLTLSAMECLPDEIIHEIFDRVPESIKNLKLVSRMLRNAANRFITRIRLNLYLPMVDIQCAPQNARHSTMTRCRREISISASITVPADRSDLFELRLKHFVVNEDFPMNRIYSFHNDDPVYRLNFEISDDDSLLIRLNKCIAGSTIRQVNIRECYDATNRERVSKILGGVNVRELEFAGAANDEGLHVFIEFINKLVYDNKIVSLKLKVHRTTASDPVTVLLSFARRLRCLFLTQLYSPRINRSKTYCFGLENANWARIILNMFALKLETLHINCLPYSGFLSNEQEDILIRDLPPLAKKIWFEAHRIRTRRELDYIDNDYAIRVNGEMLSIKHSTK